MAANKQQEAQDIFEPIVEAGKAELERPFPDLVVSGLIGGLDIGFGPVAMAVVAGRLHDDFHLGLNAALFLGSFLYPLGFVVVILGKSELFTENTLSPVAGLLTGTGKIDKLSRRWAIILTTNITGTILFSLLAAHTIVLFDQYKAVYRAMGLPLVSHSFLQATLAGVFGGWLIALTAWLLEAVEGGAARLLIVYTITYLIIALQLYHSIIGSIEVLMAMFAGAPITWLEWLTSFLTPAVLGNVIGGVTFVTCLRGFQARSGSDSKERAAQASKP